MSVLSITEAGTKSEKRKYAAFRHKLYKDDPFYSPTAEFTFEMLFNRTTEYAASCVCIPVYVSDESGDILAQALLIRGPRDDFAQMSFFEALPGQDEAVKMLTGYAVSFGRSMNCVRLYIGLNGHLSYGVGLSTDMTEPNTFDSCYSKTYYNDYFKDLKYFGLTAYSSDVADAYARIPDLKINGGITVRQMDFSRFREECTVFGDLCRRTIGETFLFSETDDGHFFDLLNPMRFFLEPQNILLAYSGDIPVGFLFWHPDYCEIFPYGRQTCLLEIAVRYTIKKRKIGKVKLNSMGVLPEYRGRATLALLQEFKRLVMDYSVIETNFVWDNNYKSSLLNRDVLKNTARRFRVYEIVL